MNGGNTRLARRLLWFAAFVDCFLLIIMLCSASSGGAGWVLVLGVIVNGSVGFYAHRQGLFFELQKEHTWKAVCSGIGFTSTKTVWVPGIGTPHRKEGTSYPLLRDVSGTHDCWTGTVLPFAGQTVEDYTKEADAFALAFNVPCVSFELSGFGDIVMRAGNVPVPAAYDHPGQLQTPQVATIPPLPPLLPSVHVYADPAPNTLRLLQSVPMARTLNDQTWHMPIEGQHVFIAARTGGGKGSWIWSLVLGLAPAWRAGLVTFWGCDPKRLELAIGRDWWAHYADTEENIVKLLEECVTEMFARAGQLQGKARRFTPSVETPLNVVVVDELGYLSAMLPDKKLRERAEKAVSTILALGRAVGYSLVGAVQDPRKETVGFRDLFPIRIAGGLPAPLVDLVLGEGMHDAGATCEQIPLGNTGAGVAYVMDETSLKPLCVRAAWCGDEVIQRLLVEPAHTAVSTQPEDELCIEQLDWDGKPYQLGYRPE